jgi:hypothetical protein
VGLLLRRLSVLLRRADYASELPGDAARLLPPTWLLSLTEFEVSAILPCCLLGLFDYQRDFIQPRAADAEALVYEDGTPVPPAWKCSAQHLRRVGRS